MPIATPLFCGDRTLRRRETSGICRYRPRTGILLAMADDSDMAERTHRSLLQRLLFVDSLAPASLPAPRPQEQIVITALMRRQPEVSSRWFRRCIEKELCNRLHERRHELNLASVKIYRDASARGLLSLFLQFTRSHGYTAFLCRVLRRPAPSPYRIPYGVLYDNVVQLVFADEPTSGRLEEVRTLLHSPDLACAECTVLVSDRQYVVYDNKTPGDEKRRVNICFLVNRPRNMSRDTCQSYWRTRHADLALRNMNYLRLTRYLQVHSAGSPPHGYDDSYDGVVYAEKSSRARLLLELGKPDSFRFNNTVVIDETNFTECTPIMLLSLASGF